MAGSSIWCIGKSNKRSAEVCAITENHKSVISAIGEKVPNLLPHDHCAVQLLQCNGTHTPWCNFHSERGISENTMYGTCTWHQKMVIAWDEVVRVWRDMAPGLVFCDTSLNIHPCYHSGGEGSMEKEGKRIGRGNIGFAWNSGCPCRAIWPFHRTSWLNVFNT